jgi:ABC-type lipoprotein export system ATPase subunit
LQTIVQVNDVTVRYNNDATPLLGLVAEFRSGCSAVMGPSGSGKSTLLRVIAGLQTATSGSVLLSGSEVAKATWHQSGDPRVAMVHQDYRLISFLTIADNLRIASETRGLALNDQAIAEALDRVGLPSSFASRLPSTLSGGEQQRVAIARALVCRTAIILADEPTGALDAVNSKMVAEVLAAIGQSENTAVIVATHDVTVAESMAVVFQLESGKLHRRNIQGPTPRA